MSIFVQSRTIILVTGIYFTYTQNSVVFASLRMFASKLRSPNYDEENGTMVVE